MSQSGAPPNHVRFPTSSVDCFGTFGEKILHSETSPKESSWAEKGSNKNLEMFSQARITQHAQIPPQAKERFATQNPLQTPPFPRHPNLLSRYLDPQNTPKTASEEVFGSLGYILPSSDSATGPETKIQLHSDRRWSKSRNKPQYLRKTMDNTLTCEQHSLNPRHDIQKKLIILIGILMASCNPYLTG